MNLPEHFVVINSAVDTLLLAGNQVILSNSGSSLQNWKTYWIEAVHLLDRICKVFGLLISTLKTKLMTFH